MVIKYIGRTHTFVGKPLWEILANLKNHGVGRMIIRSKQQRYQEVSYIKILKVAALPNTSQHPHDPRKVMVLVERTFRGKKIPIPVQMDGATYKPDYVLVPKDQESKYLNATEQPTERIMPQTTSFPPLLEEILRRQNKLTKTDKYINSGLKVVYAEIGLKNYRVAEEGETPTCNVPMGLGTPASPRLYANIKQNNPM